MIPINHELGPVQPLQKCDSVTSLSAAQCCYKVQELLQQYSNGGETDAGLLLQAKHYANRALAASTDDDHVQRGEAELALCDVARLNHSDWRQVEGMYESLLAKFPAHAGARHNLALLYLVWNPAKAVPQFVMAGRLAPQQARHELGLARAYLKLHEYGLAGAAVERAQRKEPENPDIKPLQDEVSRRGWAPVF